MLAGSNQTHSIKPPSPNQLLPLKGFLQILHLLAMNWPFSRLSPVAALTNATKKLVRVQARNFVLRRLLHHNALVGARIRDNQRKPIPHESEQTLHGFSISLFNEQNPNFRRNYRPSNSEPTNNFEFPATFSCRA